MVWFYLKIACKKALRKVYVPVVVYLVHWSCNETMSNLIIKF